MIQSIQRYYAIGVLAMFLIIDSWSAGELTAADVRMQVRSETDTYVGMPIVVDIGIDDAKDHQPPEVVPMEGLDIRREGPSTSSQTSITTDRNGTRRVERKSHLYRFSITPTKAGEFTVPPIKVVADGIATVTKAISIRAKESETGDLLRVEVDAKQKTVYVGEPLEVTLRILVKCFTDEQLGLRLSEESMWSLVRSESDWGFFSDRMKELRDNHQRPGGDEVFREDENGEQAEYYAYEIDATVYPKRAGQIDGGEIKVIMHYPEAIGRNEDPFGDISDDFFQGVFGRSLFRPQLQISKVRPVSVNATVASVQVKPIPEDGRPEDYRGAVGQYKILTEATPRSCQAGDPITLRIAIDGTGPMELVRAPDLSALDELTKDFKVDDAPLAGVVDGKRKTFVTTIRPNNEFVNSIPAIPYSYFDPSLEKFVTVESEPIVVYVEKAETLTLDALADDTTKTEAPSDGVSQDKDPEALMRRQQPARVLTPWMWTLLLLPPLFASLVPLMLGRARITSVIRRLVPAKRQYLRRLTHATNRAEVLFALQEYLGRITGSDDRLTAIGRLRAMGYTHSAIQAERIYAACERPVFGKIDQDDAVTTLKNDAMKIMESLEIDAASHPRAAKLPSGRTAKRVMQSVGWMLMTLCYFEGAGAEEVKRLSESQVRSLLVEAREAMDAAVDDQAASDQWTIAAEKLQMVIDSGRSNGPLHYHAGQAYAGAGQRARAIAAFLRALRIEPTNHPYRQALITAQGSQRPPDEMTSPVQQVIRSANEFKELVIAWIPLQWLLAGFAAAWIAFWMMLAVRFARWIESVWVYALTLGVISLVSGWMYFDTMHAATRTGTAVLLDNNIELREGDEETEPIVGTVADSEGMIVRRIKQRGGWVQIQVGQRVGWILGTKIESV